MNPHTSFQIEHIKLHEQPAMPALNFAQKGFYMVFWWRSIPLGHVFLNPGEVRTPQDYVNKLTSAITPTLAFYSKGGAEATEEWRTLLANQQFSLFAERMEAILHAYDLDAVPQQVPVSVIICTHGRAEHLKTCLARLRELTCLPQEIVVVDNAPKDNSTEEVVAQFPEVKYVREPRVGLDIARNTGIKATSLPLVAFVDDDVTVHPLWVYRVYEAFQDESTAALTGLVIASELETEAQLIFEKHWSFNRGYSDYCYDINYFNKTLAQGPPVWRIGAGANMAFRKSVFDTVGLFDELLDAGAAGCSGDSEMWYRILLHGFKIRYNPRAVVFHEHRKDMKGLKKQLFNYMRGHAAAALIQQQQHKKAGYIKHLARMVLKGYSRSMVSGFPFYRSHHSTLGVQVLGVFSGIAFYFKNKN